MIRYKYFLLHFFVKKNSKRNSYYGRGEEREMKRMRSNKETFKKEIGALSVVAACSQVIKHNRKHRISNTRKRKCWVKA